MGLGFYMLKRYSEAIPYLREGASRAPNWRRSHGPLAATYAQLGQLENARAEASEVLRIEPDYTIDRHRRLVPFKDPKDAEHFFDGMRKAGLPEK